MISKIRIIGDGSISGTRIEVDGVMVPVTSFVVRGDCERGIVCEMTVAVDEIDLIATMEQE